MARKSRSLAPIVTVTVAALVFAILLIAVRLHWAPLESVDHGAAADINGLIAGHPALVTVVKAVTLLGSTPVLMAIIGIAAIYLAIRRRWRLAVFLLATGAGALVLDPVLKALVGRLRPVVAHPVAHGLGNSFPSGHALGSIVCYGALLLVFLPAVSGRWRSAFIAVLVALVALTGISRILLGVHYLSDVIGAWGIGIAWLGLTTVAFELTRQAGNRPVTRPVTEGLEPEGRRDLKPAEPERKPQPPQRRPGRIAARLGVCWVLITGLLAGIGELITKDGNGNVLGDRSIPQWFAAHRTPGLNGWSLVFTTIGMTASIIVATAVTAVVFLAVTRRWRPVVYIAVLMAGELASFLVVATVIKRPRPHVSHLDPHLPTSAFPSGHTAATLCLYAGLAILVIGLARGWWRWLFLIPAIALPILVAVSRMYRGEHHPTDIIGSVLLSGLWLAAVTFMVRPAEAAGQRGRSTARQPGRRRVPAAR